MKWLERLAVNVVKKMPPLFIRDTERIGLSAGFITIGITSLMVLRERTVFQGVPKWVLVEWSLTLILGGLFTIWGMVKSMRVLERTGISLAALGCLSYGIALIATGSARSIIVGVFFLFLVLVKLTRLLVSTAASITAPTNVSE